MRQPLAFVNVVVAWCAFNLCGLPPDRRARHRAHDTAGVYATLHYAADDLQAGCIR